MGENERPVTIFDTIGRNSIERSVALIRAMKAEAVSMPPETISCWLLGRQPKSVTGQPFLTTFLLVVRFC